MPPYYQPEYNATPYWASDNFWNNTKSKANDCPSYYATYVEG